MAKQTKQTKARPLQQFSINKFRSKRKELGLGQLKLSNLTKEFAENLSKPELRIGQQTIAGWELGKVPTINRLAVAAAVMGVTPAYFLEGSS